MASIAQAPRRVAVTGLGLLTPLGLDTESTWEGLVEGRSGIAPISAFDASAFECPIAGELRGFEASQHVDAKLARRIDRSSVLAIAASKQAVQDAQLDLERQPPGSVGIVLGTGIGGAHLIVENQEVLDQRGPRRVSPFLITNMLPDTASGLVSIALGAGGPNFAVTAACATGGAAVGEAAELVRRGAADVIIAGGFEAPLKPIYYAGFQAMRALAMHDDPTQASRPFDADRNGFVISEGAGVLILEDLEHAQARGARIYAEWKGSATASDAFDMAAAADDGRGIVRAMEQVLAGNGMGTDEVDYLNAHGTSTPLNDRVETLAIRTVFGEDADRIAVSSTKSMLGHMMGAAGAVEAAVAVLACDRQIAPPTINYRTPDPECDLDYVPNEARPLEVRNAMSTSVGLGGHNSVLLFGRWEGA
ncbi:MAG: beta-ketoacyl-ACP synthase II [Chloroflexi bacterium]|nr:beta-ketoacyl-ACP synthase II [Chloroflexota bacterium]